MFTHSKDGTSINLVRETNKQRLTFAFVGVYGGGPGPGCVVVKRQTFAAVRSCRVVLASAHPRPLSGLAVTGDAFGGVAVAFTPRPHSYIGDGIEIGTQHLGIAENLISKGVESV